MFFVLNWKVIHSWSSLWETVSREDGFWQTTPPRLTFDRGSARISIYPCISKLLSCRRILESKYVWYKHIMSNLWKKFNNPLAERKNEIVAFGKDAQLLKITICLLPYEIPIGISQNVIERQTPRENYDSNIAKHMADLIHNGDSNPQNDFWHK